MPQPLLHFLKAPPPPTLLSGDQASSVCNFRHVLQPNMNFSGPIPQLLIILNDDQCFEVLLTSAPI